MSYRITLDPNDPSVVRVSRRIWRSLPVYLPFSTITRMGPTLAIKEAAKQIDADRKARLARAKAAGLLVGYLRKLFSGDE